jgi:hypothetical protein
MRSCFLCRRPMKTLQLRNRWFADSLLRGMDSNFQSGDASPPPTAWGPSFRRVSGGSLCRQLYRFAEADDRSGGSAAPTVDRPQPDRSLETVAYLARN